MKASPEAEAYIRQQLLRRKRCQMAQKWFVGITMACFAIAGPMILLGYAGMTPTVGDRSDHIFASLIVVAICLGAGTVLIKVLKPLSWYAYSDEPLEHEPRARYERIDAHWEWGRQLVRHPSMNIINYQSVIMNRRLRDAIGRSKATIDVVMYPHNIVHYSGILYSHGLVISVNGVNAWD